jgi:segregation and condensation protein B
MVPEENLPEEREAAPVAEAPQVEPESIPVLPEAAAALPETEALPEAEVESMSPEDLLPDEPAAAAPSLADAQLKAVLEAIVYITDEPLTLDQICAAIEQPRERVVAALELLSADYEKDDRGLSIREIAGGFKMTTKPEHHEAVRRFVKNLNPPLKLSLPALETLAVIAYKQPITAPEIMEIRGVQGAGVLKTLIDRKLIATAGRKQVVGKPILYKTTREFLVQFGLRDVSELPTLKEFQEIGRMDTETAPETATPAPSVFESPEPLPPIEEPQTNLPLSDPPATPDEETPGEPAPVQEPPPES